MATQYPPDSHDLDRTPDHMAHDASPAQAQRGVFLSSARQPRLHARKFSMRLSPRAVAAIRYLCLGEAIVFATLGLVFHSWAGFQAAALLMVLGSGNLVLARQKRPLSSPRSSGPGDPGGSDGQPSQRADREADFISWRGRRVAIFALLAALCSLAIGFVVGAIAGITHSAPLLGIASSPGDVLQGALCTGIGAAAAAFLIYRHSGPAWRRYKASHDK